MRDARGHYLETISEVDLSAFARNLNNIKQWVDGRQIILAVKANAYGHGIVPICREAFKLGISQVGVANLSEAVILRDSGVKNQIILLTPSTMEQIPSIVYHNLSPNVTSLSFAQILSQQSDKAGSVTHCQIELDTGMGRTGFMWDDCLGDILALARLDGIKINGFFTHFPVADSSDENDKAFTMLQLRRFASVVDKYKRFDKDLPLVHVSNSAGITSFPIYGNAVRPGIAAYGLKPCPSTESPFELEPVLSLKSQVVQIREMPKGWDIGYGRTYTTDKKELIAVVRCGYGDGLRRSLSNKGYVLIRNQKHPIVGRVSMDTIMVRLQDPEISLDDEVVLIGKQGQESISAEDHAKWTDTIPYEILTGISERVKRLYLRGGMVVGES